MNKRDRIKRARNAGKASAGVARGDSSRKNGQLGGRPRGEVSELAERLGVSRQRAWQILKGK